MNQVEVTMAISNEKLKEAYSISEKELREMEASADAYDQGEWPEGKVTLMGRPLKLGTRLKSITYRDTEETIALMDGRAAQLHMSRSDYLRWLVSRDLATH